jgi:hypothetical protein
MAPHVAGKLGFDMQATGLPGSCLFLVSMNVTMLRER